MAATDKALAGLRRMIASGTLGPGGRQPALWPRSA
jgi:hypothetical protein